MLVFFSTISIAQEEYMSEIVSKACSCLEEISKDIRARSRNAASCLYFECRWPLSKRNSYRIRIGPKQNGYGRTEKYFWYSFVDTDLLRDYSNLKDKNVSIEYHKEEFFDPKPM